MYTKMRLAIDLLKHILTYNTYLLVHKALWRFTTKEQRDHFLLQRFEAKAQLRQMTLEVTPSALVQNHDDDSYMYIDKKINTFMTSMYQVTGKPMQLVVKC